MRRRILWAIPTGLYVVGSAAGARRNLMTVSWVVQAAMEPKIVAIGIECGAVTHGIVEEGGVFALSLLERSQRSLVRRFVKPVSDDQLVDDIGTGTMQGEPVVLTGRGVPVLGAAVAWIECEVRERLALGSHSLFAGEVVDCGVGSPGATRRTADDGTLDRLDEILRMEDTRMNYGG
ncbi:MAG: flavin reductase family protein [Acidimicrobiales bacterium]